MVFWSVLCKFYYITGTIPAYQKQEQEFRILLLDWFLSIPNAGMKMTISASFHFRLIRLSIPSLPKTTTASQTLPICCKMKILQSIKSLVLLAYGEVEEWLTDRSIHNGSKATTKDKFVGILIFCFVLVDSWPINLGR